jgi:isoquinoline 1-oxidoreductase beta subunit
MSATFTADSYINDIMQAAENHLSGNAIDARGETENQGDLNTTISRRNLFKVAGLVGGGLVLAFYMGGRNTAHAESITKPEFAPNAFLRVSPDGSILIYSKGPEIGQGIKTAFPLIIAEELDADWAQVRVEQAAINPEVYGRQSAGGSRSIPASWDQLRLAGGTARAMLVAAAAKEWRVPAEQCHTEKSTVVHKGSGRQLSYAALAEKAALLPVPDEKSVKLKDRKDYKLLGTRVSGVDNRAIVTGQPLFGIDQVLPGMRYAVFEKCPATGGKVQSANLGEIKKLPGVLDAFVASGTGKVNEVMPGVAIIANSTWAAFSAKRALKITWDESSASKDSWSTWIKEAEKLSKKEGAATLVATGDFAKASADAKVVEGFYRYPFVAHAPLEPQNCTAWYHDGVIELWAPTQTPEAGLAAVAGVLGLPQDKVIVHQVRAGGGFGRRLINDFMCEAAAIARQVGAPVKLTWTREDDQLHDFFRVGGFHSFKGAIDKNGKLVGWADHFITFTADGQQPTSGGDLRPDEFPAQLLPHVSLTQTMLPLKTPTGPWRAPRSCAIAFAIQSFIHECAVAAGRDHLEFLLEIFGEPRWLKEGDPYALNTARAIAVIKLAAQQAGWGKSLPKGRGLGLAFHFSHAGHFAQVAEVSVDANKKLRVHKVTVAGDIGPIINLSGAENQVEGCVIDGYSTALGLELDIENGRIQQTNFDKYPLLRIAHAPEVSVHFIQSDYPPTGVGEPAFPPVAPAICNAIFAATGQRVRSLPLVREGYSV